MRAVALALALAGCLRSPDYHCAAATDCTNGAAQGTCESNGYCAFTDPSCASGQRFGDLSGALAGQCVGAGGDAGVVDGHPTDGGTDGSASACPSSYVTIFGGGTHVYRKITTAANWQTQVNACVADSPAAYLTVPADSNELSGIRILAGGDAWVGLSDTAMPGMYVTVNTGTVATYLPWANGQPNTSLHCVAAKGTQSRIETFDCTATQLIGVCECVP